jgi:hypothetical protein
VTKRLRVLQNQVVVKTTHLPGPEVVRCLPCNFLNRLDGRQNFVLADRGQLFIRGGFLFERLSGEHERADSGLMKGSPGRLAAVACRRFRVASVLVQVFFLDTGAARIIRERTISPARTPLLRVALNVLNSIQCALHFTKIKISQNS